MIRRRVPARSRRSVRSSTTSVFLILVAIIAVCALVTWSQGRNFFTSGNLTVVLTSVAVLGLVAIGQSLVVLVGSLDLSVAYLVSLASVLAAGVMQGAPGSTASGIATALLATAVTGALSGVLVAFVGMSGFIATLGLGLVVAGYLDTFYRGNTGAASPELGAFGSSRVGPFPILTIVMLALLVLTALLVARTRMGMHLMAAGGDADVARMSGIHAQVPVIFAHTMSGLFAGAAGVALVARLGVGSPTVGTQGGYDLFSIAAVVLGGAVLAGGRGSLWGTLGGILIFAVVDSTLGILQVNPFLMDTIRGVVIVVAVAFYARRTLPKVRRRFDGGASGATATSPTVGVAS